MPTNDTKPVRGDTSLGGGLYRDDRGKSKSYVFRGRVRGRTVRKVLRRPETGRIATVANTTVTEARRFVLELKADSAAGGQKHFAHVVAKSKASDLTVAQAWALHTERKTSKLRQRTQDRKQSLYRRFIEPAWRGRPVCAISPDDCRKLLSDVQLGFEANGHQATPLIKLRQDLNCFFDWATTRFELGVKVNPMINVKIDVTENPKPPRALSEQELMWYFRAASEFAEAPLPQRAINRSSQAPRVRKRAVEALETLLRASSRRDEILGAQWWQVQARGLFIPSNVAKMGLPILIPLTASMKALIGERPRHANDSDRIFDAGVDWLEKQLPFMRKMMTKIAMKEGFSGTFDVEKIDGRNNPNYFTPNNFRDTFMTMMKKPKNEWGQSIFSLEVRKACMNQRNRGDVANERYTADINDPDWLYEERQGCGRFWNEWLDRLKREALHKPGTTDSASSLASS